MGRRVFDQHLGDTRSTEFVERKGALDAEQIAGFVSVFPGLAHQRARSLGQVIGCDITPELAYSAPNRLHWVRYHARAGKFRARSSHTVGASAPSGTLTNASIIGCQHHQTPATQRGRWEPPGPRSPRTDVRMMAESVRRQPETPTIVFEPTLCSAARSQPYAASVLAKICQARRDFATKLRTM